MSTTMTPAEADLRDDLRRATGRVRAAIARIPDPGGWAGTGVNEVGAQILAANCALREARSIVDDLGQLDEATEEAVLLVSSARMAFDMIGHMLALLVAEADIQAA